MKSNLSASTISSQVERAVKLNNFTTGVRDSVSREVPKAVKQVSRQSAPPDQESQKTIRQLAKDSKPVMNIAGVIAGNMAYNYAVNQYNKFLEGDSHIDHASSGAKLKNSEVLSATFQDYGVTMVKCSGNSYIEGTGTIKTVTGSRTIQNSEFGLGKQFDINSFTLHGANGSSFPIQNINIKAQTNMHGQAKALMNASIAYSKQADLLKKNYINSHMNANADKFAGSNFLKRNIQKTIARCQITNDFYAEKSLASGARSLDKNAREKIIELAKQGRKNIKNVRKMGKKLSHINNLAKFAKGNLRRLPKSLIGIGMRPIKDTDAGRGMEVMEGFASAGMSTGRMAFKSGRWIGKQALRASIQQAFIIKYKITDRLNGSAARAGFPKGYTGTREYREMVRQQAANFLKNKCYDGSMSQMFAAKKQSRLSGKINNLKDIENKVGKLTNWQAKRLDILQAKREAKGDKQAFKAAKKAIKKAHVKTKPSWARKQMLKMTRKFAVLNNRLAATKFGKLVRFFGNKFGRLGKFFSSILKAIGHTIATCLGAISSAIVAVTAFVLHIILLFAGILILLWLIAQLMMLIPNPKELFGSWWKGHQAKVTFANEMNELQIQHNVFVGQIEAEMEKYPAATVIFPDGQQENYRELLSAYDTMLNNESNQYDDGTDSYSTVLKELYNQTHFISTEDFTYSNPDGSTASGVRIYVEIQRNENLGYSALAGQGTLVAGGATGNCPAGSVVNDDWIAVVKTVKQLLAATGTGYDQTTTVPISVNGTTMQVRPDCSGMVSACLNVYGSFAGGTWSSSQFTFASELNGFTKYSFSGWENLCQGDIISYDGHVEIFAYNVDGRHYVWNAGSTESVRNPEATTDSRSTYITVWRPNSSVNTDSSAGEVTGGDTDGDDSGESDLGLFENLKLDWKPSFSNTTNFEEDGNESGYGTSVVSTVQNEIDSGSSVFNEDNYDAGYGNHSMLTDAVTSTSSYDFARYICAQHGVQLPATLYELMVDNDYIGETSISYSPNANQMKIGDIVFFQRVRAFDGTMTYNKLMKAILDSNAGTYTGPESIEDLKDEFNTYVPMIYVGNNQYAAYDKDLTLITNMGKSAADNTEFADSEAKVRLYTFDDSCLRYQRIMCAIRPTGYTKNAVYGAKGSFAGWTDDNIRQLYAMISMDYWTTGVVKTYDDNLEETETPFYDSWAEGSFSEFANGTFAVGTGVYYNDTYTYASTTVTSDMVNAIWEEAKAIYDDYQILPSVLIAEAVAKSNGRSTEESLTYNNIYEVQTDPDNVAAGRVDKYYYDSPTSSMTDAVAFKKFKSIAGAVLNHAKALESYGGYDNAEQMIKDLTTAGIYTTGVRDEMISYINTHLDVQNYDTLMLTRQDYIDSCGAKYISLNWNLYVHGSSTDDFTFHDEDREIIRSWIATAQTALDTLTTYIANNDLPDNDITSSLQELITRAQAVLDVMDAHKSIEDMPSYTITTIVVANGQWTYTFVFNEGTGAYTQKAVYTASPTAVFTYNYSGTYTSWSGTEGGKLSWTGKRDTETKPGNYTSSGTISSITTQEVNNQ